MPSIRITRKKYDKAREAVTAAEKQAELVQQWENAVEQIDSPRQVDAITVHDDGSLRFELLHDANVSSDENQTSATGDES